MNNFVRVIDGFKTNNVFYQDTDSLYIERNIGTQLDEGWIWLVKSITS